MSNLIQTLRCTGPKDSEYAEAANAAADEIERLMAGVDTERDRCAKIIENWLEVYGATNPQHIAPQTWANDAMLDIVEMIRHPKPK